MGPPMGVDVLVSRWANNRMRPICGPVLPDDLLPVLVGLRQHTLKALTDVSLVLRVGVMTVTRGVMAGGRGCRGRTG